MTAAPPSQAELTADEARRIALRAQGLLGTPDHAAGVPGVLRRLGAVQLDTISVLARSHELVPYARLGAVGRRAVEDAYWPGDVAFEYWSHAACVLPIEEWPWFAFRRRAHRASGGRERQLHDHARSVAEVRARLAGEGPLTAGQLGGARRGGEWWDWSQTKIAVESLLDTGEVVCTRRTSWKRVYDLAERAIPAELHAAEPDDDTCLRQLVGQAGVALGVATQADLADYYRLRPRAVSTVIAESGLVPVTVAGWPEPVRERDRAWADPAALAEPPRGRHRTTLLSPFDSLVWDRPRTERIFGMAHRLEAYTPRARRQYGYFAMPVLTGGRLVARVDPAREDGALVARQVTFEGTARQAAEQVPRVAEALREAAGWVGADAVRVERVLPAEVHGTLAAAVAPDATTG